MNILEKLSNFKNSFEAGNDIEKIKENLYYILSYDTIVASGQSAYCEDEFGGGIRNSLIDRLRNFLN
tara:strand:+ start:263 stop:463 length:201 start_codon:yes stop_codon:yes gene_type:complete